MELPEEVVVAILSRLHPFEAVRAKLVCRAWRQAISNLSSSSPPSCALGFAIDSVTPSCTLLYADPSSLSWRHLPLLPQPASLHAIADSFLCLSTSLSLKPQQTQLHVLNPLSRSHVCIPQVPSRSAPFLVGLCLRPLSHGFKVVIAGHKSVAECRRPFDLDLELLVQVYDSASNSWHSAGSVAGAAAEYANPVCVGSQVYWLCRRNIRRHVLVFNAEDESWRMLGASSHKWWPQDLSPYTLWAWEGEIYMAGELENALTIWKLAMDESEWVIHMQISPHVVQIEYLCGCKDVAGHGPLLCMMLAWARKGIVYDLCTHAKSWLPYCSVSSTSWGNVIPYKLGFANLS